MLDAALLAGLNHLLAGANWARARLGPYASRHACFEMPPFRLAFVVNAAGCFEPVSDAAPPDVTIRLPADTPFLLPHGLDRVMAAARVDGNAEFATELSFVFRHLHWNAEEDLSRLVGDIAAHRLVAGAGRLADWQRRAAGHFAENIAEYLVHEKGSLVGRDEFAAFAAETDRLDATLAGLEKRIEKQNHNHENRRRRP
jgi:ubiquinone biosynthesis protein UbiJ